MAASSKAAGEHPHTFPQRAQLVAYSDTSHELWLRRGAPGDGSAPAESGEFSLRVHPALSFFAATLIAALPVHAFAQEIDRSVSVRERPRPDYDPLGLRFGGFNLHAALDLSATATDNVFATETNEQEDTILTAAPRARLASDWSRHQLAVEAGAAFTSHTDFSSEDAETAYLGAEARLDIGRDSHVRVIGRVSDEIEPRTDPDALFVGGPVEFSRTSLAAEAQHTFNRVRLRGRLEALEHDFDDVGAIDQDFRDSEETIATLRADVAVAPRIGILLEASADERDLDNAPALNSEGHTYLAGVSINFTDLMYGEISAGQFEREYDFGGTVDGTAVSGRLEWYITQLTTLNFFANRSVEDTGATVGTPYVQTEYGARVDHELQRNIIITAGARGGQREYEIISRDDEYLALDIGADYLLNRRVALFGRYRFDSLESSGANRYRDFDVNAFTLGVSLRL